MKSSAKIIAPLAAAICAVFLICSALPRQSSAQLSDDDEQYLDDELDQGLFEDAQETAEDGAPAIFPGIPDIVIPDIERQERGEERRWGVRINAAVRANYVFNDTPNNFVIKYAFELIGDAGADTAVIRGEAQINAEVEGYLAKWPTGECALNVAIPKIPFEIVFRKTGDDRGSVALRFRSPIMEDWRSTCSFTDEPGARFETSGPPEKWLASALDKARPPLRSIVADISDEETTTSFVIPKEVLDDPPLGSVEIEGAGVITITPGG